MRRIFLASKRITMAKLRVCANAEIVRHRITNMYHVAAGIDYCIVHD